MNKFLSIQEAANASDDSSLEEDLAKDVLEIFTVFYAKLYGSRSQKNKALIKDLKQACEKHVFGKVLYQDRSYFRK